MKKVLAVFFLVVFFSGSAWAATYSVDPDHSTVSFKVKHLLSKTQGQFKKFEGSFDFEPGKPETWTASGVIQTESIDTNVAERDKHLKSADFFEVEKFPTIEFKTTAVKDATETGAKVEGVMKMHGIEKPVVLDVTIGGVAKDPWGNTRAAFTATTKINRKDFGINWNKTLDAGGLLLGEDVDITLEIEGIEKK